jgi:hypothetical protein
VCIDVIMGNMPILVAAAPTSARSENLQHSIAL